MAKNPSVSDRNNQGRCGSGQDSKVDEHHLYLGKGLITEG